MRTPCDICSSVASWSAALGVVLLSSVSSADPVPPALNPDSGNVTWGISGAIKVDVDLERFGRRGSKIRFRWTNAGEPHPRFGEYFEENETDTAQPRHFIEPYTNPNLQELPVTDYQMGRYYPSNPNADYRSQVINLSGSAAAWIPRPLEDIGTAQCRFAWLEGVTDTSDPAATIYSAVNLQLYIASNPDGFLDGLWQPGQLLGDLGLEIVNGRIDGLDGVVFASTPFVFDPTSEMGWAPIGGPSSLINSAGWEAEFGSIVIDATTMLVPAPGTAGTLLLVSLMACRRRRARD